MGVHSFEADLNTRIGDSLEAGLTTRMGGGQVDEDWGEGGSSLEEGLTWQKMGAPGGRRGCWGGGGWGGGELMERNRSQNWKHSWCAT